MNEGGSTITAEQFIALKSASFGRDREAGRVLVMKDIERQGFHLWRREAWTFLVETNLPTKVFVIERLRFAGTRGQPSEVHREGREAEPVRYRFGYWVVARNGRAAGRWWWAQFSPMIPPRDFEALLAKARSEGTIK
jgi:hypothetical protein